MPIWKITPKTIQIQIVKRITARRRTLDILRKIEVTMMMKKKKENKTEDKNTNTTRMKTTGQGAMKKILMKCMGTHIT